MFLQVANAGPLLLGSQDPRSTENQVTDGRWHQVTITSQPSKLIGFRHASPSPNSPVGAAIEPLSPLYLFSLDRASTPDSQQPNQMPAESILCNITACAVIAHNYWLPADGILAGDFLCSLSLSPCIDV